MNFTYRRFQLLNIIFLLCLAGNACGQTVQQKQDSLLAVLPKAKDDTNKVLLLCDIAGNYSRLAPEKGIDPGKQALKLATSLGFDHGIVLSNLAVGRSYAMQNDRSNGLRYFQDALTTARKMNDHASIGKALISLGNVYRQNFDQKKAIDHYLQAEKAYDLAGIRNKEMIMGNIATSYAEEYKFAEALPYCLKAIEMELANEARPATLSRSYSNAAGAYAGLHKYDSALYYSFKAKPLAEEMGDTRSLINIYNTIGRVYLDLGTLPDIQVPYNLKNRQKNLELGLTHCLQALGMSRELGIKDMQLHVMFNIMHLYAGQQKYKQAFEYARQYNMLSDTMYSAGNEKELANVEAEYKVRATTDSLKYQNLVKDNELVRRRNTAAGAIGLILFTGIVAVLLINRQKLKHIQKRKMAEAEQARMEELASYQLEDFTQRIHEKNELIGAITADLEKQKEQAAAQGETVTIDYSLLEELQQSILLTDEQWDKFKNTFDKVHRGYLIRLRDKMPDLTPAETRFVVLTKLRLSNKEMGAMLGVGVKAIFASKYRLMKKFGIEEHDNLDTLILNI